MSPRHRVLLSVTVVVMTAIVACRSNEPVGPTRALSGRANAAQGPSKGQEAQCDTVGIMADTTEIVVGATLQRTAQPYGNNAKPLDKATVAWSSLDPSVAVVSSSGLVTGISAGSAMIRAACSATPGFGAVLINVD